MDKNSKIYSIVNLLEQLIAFIDHYKSIFLFNHNLFFTQNLWENSTYSALLNELVQLQEFELCCLNILNSNHHFDNNILNNSIIKKPNDISKNYNCVDNLYISNFENLCCSEKINPIINNLFIPSIGTASKGYIVTTSLTNSFSEVTIFKDDLNSYIKNLKKFSIDNSPFLTDIQSILEVNLGKVLFDNTFNCDYLTNLMSIKKQHEVKHLSFICQQLAMSRNLSKVIDLGSGLGYFGCNFAMECQLMVVGVEAIKQRSDAALKRKFYLLKRWNNYLKKSNKKLEDISYRTMTCFVDETSDLNKIFNEAFATSTDNNSIIKNNDDLLLTGLHTCGDLASNILRIFVFSKFARVLCSVGCCYNLLTEEDTQDGKLGFPMSSFLLKKNFYLGHDARNIAAQSANRSQNHLKSHDSLFWRAVLQVIIRDHYLTSNIDSDSNIKIGHIANKCRNFNEYVTKSMNKLHIYDKIDCEKYLMEYDQHRSKCLSFYHLKSSLGPVIEHIILLDRLLWILSQEEINSAYLVKLFDSSISARCHAIVAFKQQEPSTMII